MNNYQNVGNYEFTPEAISLIGEAKVAYVRKVYSYFGLGLLGGVAGSLVAMNTSLVFFFASSPFIGLLLFLGIVFMASRASANPTTALPMLVAATFVSGLVISPTLFAIANGYTGAGPNAIYTALLMTVTVFAGLTAYTWISKKDFSYMGASLMIGLFMLIGVSVANIFLQSSTLALAASFVGVIIFSGFILYDTSRILRQPHVVPPAMAALSLYLNFLNLFMMLLHIVGIGSNDE